jgi:hypothetical protein
MKSLGAFSLADTKSTREASGRILFSSKQIKDPISNVGCECFTVYEFVDSIYQRRYRRCCRNIPFMRTCSNLCSRLVLFDGEFGIYLHVLSHSKLFAMCHSCQASGREKKDLSLVHKNSFSRSARTKVHDTRTKAGSKILRRSTVLYSRLP